MSRGWLDGFWELELGAWDMAAGVLIVEEAGGGEQAEQRPFQPDGTRGGCRQRPDHQHCRTA